MSYSPPFFVVIVPTTESLMAISLVDAADEVSLTNRVPSPVFCAGVVNSYVRLAPGFIGVLSNKFLPPWNQA